MCITLFLDKDEEIIERCERYREKGGKTDEDDKYLTTMGKMVKKWYWYVRRRLKIIFLITMIIIAVLSVIGMIKEKDFFILGFTWGFYGASWFFLLIEIYIGWWQPRAGVLPEEVGIYYYYNRPHPFLYRPYRLAPCIFPYTLSMLLYGIALFVCIAWIT